MANENMDMKRMQEEAIHRVQEMHNRANQQLRGTPSFAASPRTNRSNNGPSFSSGTHGNHTEEPAHHTPNEQGGPLHGHNIMIYDKRNIKIKNGYQLVSVFDCRIL